MLRLRLALGLALIAGSRALAAPIPVTGWVGDAHGKPLAGARITLSPLPSAFEQQRLDLGGPAPASPTSPPAPEPQKATSDPGGSFAVGAEAGMWTVRLEAAGAVPVELDLLPPTEPRELPPFRTGSFEDVRLEVRVVAREGRPMAGARVLGDPPPFRIGDWRPAPRRGETGPDGRVRLPRARGERLKLRVLAPGFPPAEVEAGESQALVRLSAALPRTVEVRGADGRPVAGALVAPGPGLPASALTDEAGQAAVFPRPGRARAPSPGPRQLTDGRAEIDDLPPGAWRVRVKGPGGKAWEGTAVTAQGAPAQVVLR